jgi:hypothetical protein
MPRRNLLIQMVTLAVLILFSCCLVRLLLLRYERGDVYPAYSTLRADPLGTRALYEALQSNGFTVHRGYHSLPRELKTKPDSIYYLALSADEILTFDKDEAADLDRFVRDGGRVVLTFKPEEPITSEAENSNPFASKKKKPDAGDAKKDSADKEKAKEKTPPEKDSDENISEPRTAQEKYERKEFHEEKENDPDWERDHMDTQYHPSLAALWGFGWERQIQPEKKKSDSGNPGADDDTQPLPEVEACRVGRGTLDYSVPWKSALYFTRLELDWEILYNAKNKPVLIRRPLGRGEILLATDTYFLSNEGLRNDRRPNLLSLVAGPAGSMLFDEVHLGTQQQEGVMSLVEKFRLQGYLYGMACVVVLLLWRNSIPLVPPQNIENSIPSSTVSGKDSRSGLINLLRRNIPSSEILKASFTEWKRGITPGQHHLKPKVAAMESILNEKKATRSEEIVSIYHELCAINSPRRNKGTHAAKS